MKKSVFRRFDTEVTVFPTKNVQLYETIGKLKGLLIMYSNNNYDQLNLELTNSAYVSYSRVLNIPYPDDKNAELIRLTGLQILMALRKMLMAYNEYIGLKKQYKICEARCNILDDMKLLQEYLDILVKRMNATSVFGEFGITTKAVTINPDYIPYILKYGYPEDGIFDTAKLGAMR
jgi:hypothetical protein